MSYDFGRNYTSTFSNGFTTEVVNSQLHTLHGFFGPKFQTGSGPFRVFVTGKVGFDNFGVSNQNASAGFVNTVGLTNGATYFALYPGGGVEAFAGPIGLRAEIGDDIFFNNGAHNSPAGDFWAAVPVLARSTSTIPWDGNPHFSQTTREMGHRPGTRQGNVAL